MLQNDTRKSASKRGLKTIVSPILLFLVFCFFSVAMNLQASAGKNSLLQVLTTILWPVMGVLIPVSIIIRLAFRQKPGFVWIAELIILLFTVTLMKSFT